MRLIQIVDLAGRVRFDEIKIYPGISQRDAFMLYVMASPLDASNTQRIELVVDDEVVDQITFVQPE